MSQPIFTGYPIHLERHAEIMSYGLPIYHQFRESFNEYAWEPPKELDPRPWFDIHNQGNQGSCFPAGTKVSMADGTVKNIEDVNDRDAVITHFGRSRNVVRTMRRQFTGKLITAFVKGWGKVTMTEDHVVMVNSGEWKRADELTTDDMLVLSPGICDPEETIDLTSYASGKLVESDCGTQFKLIQSNRFVPKRVMLDNSLCWLLGLFAAEGSVDRSACGNVLRLTFTTHVDEVETHAKIMDYFRQFGFEAQISRKPDSKAMNVRIGCAELAVAFVALVGKYHNRKRVPPQIVNGSADQKRAFLHGWFCGDGSFRKLETGRMYKGHTVACRQIHGCTGSRVLAQQVSTMLVAIGMKPGRTLTKKRAHQTSHSYQVFLYADDAESLSETKSLIPAKREIRRSLKWNDYGQLRPIRTITSRDVTDFTVYDFEVEQDHSFVAQGLVVHNCQGQSLADSGEWLYVIAEGKEIQLSRGFAYLASQEYDGIRGDSGSTLSGGTKAAARGLPLESSFEYTDNYNALLSRYRSQRDSLLAGDVYQFPGAAPLASAEDCYRWLSGWLGTIQIGIAWGLPDAWEITSYSPGRGGHAVVIAGYVHMPGWGDIEKGFLLKNSWSTRWGRNGWALVHPRAIDQMISYRQNVFVARSDMRAPRPRRERIDHFHLAVSA